MDTLDCERDHHSHRHIVGDIGELPAPARTTQSESLANETSRDATRSVLFADRCVLVIGAGKTAAAMATCFQKVQPHRLIVANRTLAKGRSLADRCGGEAVSLDDLPDHLSEADVVVSCTASERPILSKVVVQEALRVRRHQPLFVADIAARGDVEVDVRNVREVFFTTMADLYPAEREDPDDLVLALQAQAVVHWQITRLQAWQEELLSHACVGQLQKSAQAHRDATLKRASQLLRAGKPPAQVLEFLAHTLTNKLMHSPSAALRAASMRGDLAFLQSAERLFDPEWPRE